MSAPIVTVLARVIDPDGLVAILTSQGWIDPFGGMFTPSQIVVFESRVRAAAIGATQMFRGEIDATEVCDSKSALLAIGAFKFTEPNTHTCDEARAMAATGATGDAIRAEMHRQADVAADRAIAWQAKRARLDK